MRRQIVLPPDAKIVRLGGRPSRLMWTLLVVQSAIFLLFVFADGPVWIAENLALSAARALGLFQLYQPLTAPWVHVEVRPILVNLATLWFAGSALERWWGARRFFIFYYSCAVGGMLLAMFVGMAWPTLIVSGTAGATSALLLGLAMIFPQHMVYFYGIFPMRAKWLGALLLVFIAVGSIFGRSYLQVALQLGGALTALLFLLSPRRWWAQRKVARAKRRFRVIDGRSQDGPTYLN
ncbi:MAG: rhomboid family intramembrane serine protease [Deltaproteobacteria bacterium]|nr:rhomboid family intramembrane serine protease [Deltaproteobacteria bacterium]